MIHREPRRYSSTPEEQERLARRACPNCGRERADFNFWNLDAVCCRPACTTEYWGRQPTIAEMKQRVLAEQEGNCAHCGKEIPARSAPQDCGPSHHHCVMDHIRPLAMGGDQWARENLQVLCRRCNRIKTARDMGDIARWKKYFGRGLALREDSRQVLLVNGDFPGSQQDAG
jgi:5-methylcytosine-specific restriction endonuclease McrA